MTTTTRALLIAMFSVGLALAGCGSITPKDAGTTGAAGDGAGGTAGSGAGGSDTGGTTGTGGAAGSTAGRGGSGGQGGRGGVVGAGGSNAGRGGSAGRGGMGGSSAGRGGSNGGGAGGRGGAAGSATGGRGGAAGSGMGGSGAGGRGGAAGSGMGGSSAGGRGGMGGGPCVCPQIVDPVCGVDGKTYNNTCEAMCVGVQVAYQGACVNECQSNSDCVHYADGVGDCCGACLPKTAPRPDMISCFAPCMMPITCPCVAGKCTPLQVGGATR